MYLGYGGRGVIRLCIRSLEPIERDVKGIEGGFEIEATPPQMETFSTHVYSRVA